MKIRIEDGFEMLKERDAEKKTRSILSSMLEFVGVLRPSTLRHNVGLIRRYSFDTVDDGHLHRSFQLIQPLEKFSYDQYNHNIMLFIYVNGVRY